MSVQSTQERNTFHLPDFCSGNTTLAVVLIVELVALLLSTARAPLHSNFWVDLATSSLFLLWQGLIVAAVLCRTRSRLKAIGGARAYTITLSMIILCSLAISEIIYQIGYYAAGGFGMISDVFPVAHRGFLLRTFAVTFI